MFNAFLKAQKVSNYDKRMHRFHLKCLHVKLGKHQNN